MQPRVLGLVSHAHAPAADLLNNAVVRNRLPDHWHESYVCKTGKSMKGSKEAASHRYG